MTETTQRYIAYQVKMGELLTRLGFPYLAAVRFTLAHKARTTPGYAEQQPAF